MESHCSRVERHLVFRCPKPRIRGEAVEVQEPSCAASFIIPTVVIWYIVSPLSVSFALTGQIWYHTGVKEEGESRVSSHSLDPPQLVWTRVERIQHLPVYGECLEKSASSRWHATSHHFAMLASCWWVTRQERSAL